MLKSRSQPCGNRGSGEHRAKRSGEQSPTTENEQYSRSFFQSNLTRECDFLREISWKRAQTGAAIYMVVTY